MDYIKYIPDDAYDLLSLALLAQIKAILKSSSKLTLPQAFEQLRTKVNKYFETYATFNSPETEDEVVISLSTEVS